MSEPLGECGHVVTAEDGEESPCGRDATGWRWYQNEGEHEDLLDVACQWHSNTGGQRMADMRAALSSIVCLTMEKAVPPARLLERIQIIAMTAAAGETP